VNRALCLSLLVAATLLPAASGAPEPRLSVGAGLSVVVPRGWQLSRTLVTICSDPRQLLVATTGRVRLRTALHIPPRAALVLLMEGSSGRFPARPSKFTLPPLGNLGGCCEIPVGRGAELLFRDHGRKFYAFVYVGERAPPAARRDLLRLLNSVRVTAPR
jgi:hypothetical protein